MADQVNPFIQAQRAKGTPSSEGNAVIARSTQYGENVSLPLHQKQHMLADEGSYFVARNPTPGTGVAGHAAPTTLDDTKPFLELYSQYLASQNPSRRIYLDYLKLTVTAAGTGGTAVNLSIKTDSGDRGSSAGTASTPVNANQDSSAASSLRVFHGARVATAATAAARIQFHQQLRPVISVVQDVYVITFGAGVMPASALISSGTTIMHAVYHAPPIVIGPAQACLFHIWQPSQSAASSYEYELGFWER